MLTRDFVSTVYIVKDAKVLLVFHKKLDMWLPPGGHIEENELPCDAARREVLEETGLEVEFIGDEEELGAGVKKLTHPKVLQLEDIEEGHQHIDLIYFARFSKEALNMNKESNDSGWFSIQDLQKGDFIESVRLQGIRAIKELSDNNFNPT